MNELKITIPEAKKVDITKIDKSNPDNPSNLLEVCGQKYEHLQEMQDEFVKGITYFFEKENYHIEDQENKIKEYYINNKSILTKFEDQLSKLSEMNKKIMEQEEKIKGQCNTFEIQIQEVKSQIDETNVQLSQNQDKRNDTIKELNGQALSNLNNPSKDNLNQEIFNFIFCVVFNECRNIDDAVDKLKIDWHHQQQQQKQVKTSFFTCSAKKFIPDNSTEKKWKAFKDYAFSQDGALIKQKLKELKSETLTTMQKMVCENFLHDKSLILKSLDSLDVQMAVKLLIDFTEGLMQVKDLVAHQKDLEQKQLKIKNQLQSVEKVKDLKLNLYKFNVDLTNKLKKQIEVVQKIIAFFDAKMNQNKEIQKQNDKIHGELQLDETKNKADLDHVEEIVRKQIQDEKDKQLQLKIGAEQLKTQKENIQIANQIKEQNDQQLEIQKKAEAEKAERLSIVNNPEGSPVQQPAEANIEQVPEQEIQEQNEGQNQENQQQDNDLHSLKEGFVYKKEEINEDPEDKQTGNVDPNILVKDDDTDSLKNIKLTLFSKLLETEQKQEQSKTGVKQSYFESVLQTSKKNQNKI